MMRHGSRGLWWLLGLLLAGWLPHAAAQQQDFLDPEDAFRLSAAASGREVELRFQVADGYYLYDEQFGFTAGDDVRLGPAQLPDGKVKYDETFKKDVETHRGLVRIRVPVEQAPADFELRVRSQGCADLGLCYPPAEHLVRVRLTAFGASADRVEVRSLDEPSPVAGGAAGWLRDLWQRQESAVPLGPGAAGQGAGVAAGVSTGAESGRIEAALQSGRWSTTVAVFFVAGLLLSLTPCVLPMIPILSSIIVGEAEAGGERPNRRRALPLAASYSLGMALVYTLLGVAAGLAGEGLAAFLQTPVVLGAFAALLVLFALSMFGFYELQPPAALRERLSRASSRLTGGRLAGVFLMGGLSALIVSPCVAAPLAGALVYISQTRDVWLGGAALFALACGMSVPLLLVGASAGHWLPRSGAWMEHVKHFFGAVLLAVAIWLLQPVLPGWLAMLAWGALLLIGAVYLRVFDALPPGAGGWARFAKGVGAVLAVLGVVQLVGAASGGRDPWQPLAHLARGAGQGAVLAGGVSFQKVRSVEELDRVLASTDRPVMLDFYADWCVSCKEMEAFTFSDPRVQAKLAGALLLKADVTANNADDRALLRRFGLFGPPGTIFFDPDGREMHGVRVIGFQSAERFLQTLTAAGL